MLPFRLTLRLLLTQHMKKTVIRILLLWCLIFPSVNEALAKHNTSLLAKIHPSPAPEGKELNQIFPLEHYSQALSHWLDPKSKTYKQPVIPYSLQQTYYKILFKNYYGDNSPWSKKYIEFLMKPEPHTGKTIYKGILTQLKLYKNDIVVTEVSPFSLLGYNFRYISKEWLENIQNKIELSQFKHLSFQESHRFITTDNMIVRALPSSSPVFNSPKVAGSGYPFDLLNLSIITAATPVYVFGYTKYKDWCFVVAPTIMGWVPNKNLAKVDASFIKSWRKHCSDGLTAITTSKLSIVDTDHTYHFNGIVGTLLPTLKDKSKNATTSFHILIPIKTSGNSAAIAHAYLKKEDGLKVPAPLTVNNYAQVIHTLLNQPYGWGGYNFNFDCSLETLSVYKVFGIFLYRNSISQISWGGRMDNLSQFSPVERLNKIKQKAIPLATLLYVKGHIMSYLGTYSNTSYGSNTVMVYHNIWGLAPQGKNWRSIIGQSVIFPLILNYKEEPEIEALVKKPSFYMTTLNLPIDKKVGLSNMLY